jgi:meso-butanediol dehydrogenase/(S,S)-butanediol dehydrogenase/diacetyl reductase
MRDGAMRRFADRVALVTGAGSGIGRATALRLADEGATLHLADVQAGPLDAVADDCRARGAAVERTLCDQSDERQVDATVAACVARFARLDVLCNVAGILRFDHTHELRTEDWNRVLAVNLSGPFFFCRAALPHLVASRGNIVNVASTAALSGQPWSAAYAASKGGVLSLTRNLAIDYVEQGVRANAVCPGDIRTPIVKSFRLPDGANAKLLDRIRSPRGSGTPESVAGVIAMLASDDGAHITGAEIRVDGGMLS